MARINSRQIRDSLTGESFDLVFEALLNILIQKGVLENPEEFLDVIESIKVAKELTKE